MNNLIGFGNILFFTEPGENPGLLVQSSYAMPTERLDRKACETLYFELAKLLGKPTSYLGVDTSDVHTALEMLIENGDVNRDVTLTPDEAQFLFWEAMKNVEVDTQAERAAISETVRGYAEHNHLTPKEAQHA